MGISLITAMAISARDDLVFTHARSAINGKYAGWVTTPNGRPILNTEAVFDTSDQAEKNILELREKCKAYFNDKSLDIEGS